MAELWRDIEDDIDDELDERKATVDLDDAAATVDASVDLGPWRSMVRPLDIVLAATTLALGLAAVYWLSLSAVIAMLVIVLLFVAWAAIIAGLEFFADLTVAAIELSFLSDGAIMRVVRRSRLSMIVLGAVVVWGAAWHLKLSPTARNRAQMDRLVAIVEERIGAGETLPDKDLAAWLGRNELVDVWGEPLVYRKGEGGRYQLYSCGRNRFDEVGKRDDEGHVEPLSGVAARVLDKAVGAAKSLIKPDEKDTDHD